MPERNSAFREVEGNAFSSGAVGMDEAANEAWVADVIPGTKDVTSELPKEAPNKIVDPFEEMLPAPEAKEVSFESYKELYEFAVSNGFSPEALADIKAKAEAEELTLN